MNQIDDTMDDSSQQHEAAINRLAEVMKEYAICEGDLSENWRPLLAFLSRFDLDKGFPKPD